LTSGGRTRVEELGARACRRGGWGWGRRVEGAAGRGRGAVAHPRAIDGRGGPCRTLAWRVCSAPPGVGRPRAGRAPSCSCNPVQSSCSEEEEEACGPHELGARVSGGVLLRGGRPRGERAGWAGGRRWPGADGGLICICNAQRRVSTRPSIARFPRHAHGVGTELARGWGWHGVGRSWP
jgi:hypothetical protein